MTLAVMTWDSVFILLRLEDLLRVLLSDNVFCLSRCACIVVVESCPLFVPFDSKVYSEWAGGDYDFFSGGGASLRLDLSSVATVGVVFAELRLSLG
jgi:hypothetical protein